ncbi:MAG: N-6 DNA methylase [Thermofilum sp.]|nr:N-6 DNA methylase [Thermofilum sp.]
MYGRERPLQDELYRLLANITRNKRFAGLTLTVQTEFPIDTRRTDIAVLKEPEGIPILIIETKRKVERRGYYRREERLDPYGRAVLGQALSYAALIKEKYNLQVTPAFATANRDAIVLFSPVREPHKYLNWEAVEAGDYENVLEPAAYVSLIHEYYLFDKKNPLREELLQYILDQVARIWQREVLPEAVRKKPGAWLLGKLRYFVDSLSRYYVEDILRARLTSDERFAADLNALALKAGYKNGLADIVGENYSSVGMLARMMVYALMNKIIFYKVLERHYNLEELKPILRDNPEISSEKYLSLLNQRFREAIEKTGDFEQIFITGLFDHIILPEDRDALNEIDELIQLLSEIEVERLGDIIGYIYEELIPAEERHRMGQFYTPQPIAELIAKWCINGNPSATVLGPGCGSGTFEVEAYWLLSYLKTGRRRGIPPGSDAHKSILKQIYALDINPFPAQLTAMNLAMKNVRAPTTEANILTADFFSIIPGQEFIAPYPVMTPSGPRHKEVVFPKGFDVVMGNPPYTRWTEIPRDVQKKIEESLGDLLTKYNLRADVKRGREPGLYVYFIMHAHKFLKPGGRLGMIISDSWLQTAYGVDFGRYLLENFKVKALIDISARVFPVPLIGTCIILLEKPAPGESIENNKIVFMYLSIPKGETFKVEDILWAINNPEKAKERYWIKVYRQGDIPKDKRWLDLLFRPDEILEVLKQSSLIKKLSEYFEPCYGNILYLYLTSIGKIRGVRNVGGEEFFYLTEERARGLGIPQEFLHPLLPSSRYLKFFTFTREDWENLKKEGAECYLFLCHKSRNELPESVRNYIRLGEGPDAQIRLRRRPREAIGKPVSESLASQTRRKHGDIFFEWYDLGGVVQAPIYVARGSRYWVRFVLAKYQCALDDRVLALIPKQGVKFDEIELKALLAYLNSSFAQLQAELRGRTAGGVALLELDVKPLSDFLILDVKRLPREDIEVLAKLFDDLDSEARRLEGADAVENVFGSELAKDLTGREYIKEDVPGLFNTTIKEIDEKIGKILQMEALVEHVRAMIVELARRRLSRATEANTGALSGSEEQLYRRNKRRRGRTESADSDDYSTKLTDFM